MNFQWLFNGELISDATNSVLQVVEAQAEQVGSYLVVVTNSLGSVTSAPAFLTVNPLPPCAPVAAGLAAWWPLNGDGAPQIGGSHLALSGDPGVAPGMVAQGLESDGVDDAGYAPANAGLDIGAGAGLTVEMWIRPLAVADPQALVEWSDEAATVGLHFWLGVSSPFSGGGSGSLFANLIDTQGGQHHVSSAAGIIQRGVFQHVAVTYDREAGIAQLYLNGISVAQTNVGRFSPETRTGLFVGRRLLGGTAYRYRGVMDELALYHRALTAAELAGIYQAGAAGKCPSVTPTAPVILVQPVSLTVWSGQEAMLQVSAQGTPPPAYQWILNETDLVDETNAVLTFANAQPAQDDQYAVRVFNSAGSITSDTVTLTVLQDTNPPAVVRQPISHNVRPGANTTFSVAAEGAVPLVCFWRLNEVGIPNANENVLTILNAQDSDAGTYSVVVSNAFGLAVSDEAVLTVTNTFAGGTVNFANASATAVYDIDGVAKLWGESFRAELLAGPNPGELAVVGASAEFIVPGIFVGGMRTILSVPSGQIAYVQVRVWDLNAGTNYDQCLAQQGRVGASEVFPVQMGGAGLPPMPPASLYGLKSFSITQGITAGSPLPVFISPGRRLADGSQEWVLHGESGVRYVIERSTNLSDWERFSIVTPVDGTANFSERAWTPRTFYRARRFE